MQLLTASLGDLRRAARPVALFMLAWALLEGIVLLPILGWLLDQFVTSGGRLAISNYDIASFLLSPIGFAFLTFTGVVHLVLLHAQQAGLLLIAHQFAQGTDERLLMMLSKNLRRIPNVARLALIELLIGALIFLPCAAALALIYHSLLSAQDINYYLAAEPPEWNRAVTMGVIVLGLYGIAILLLLLRWLMALPLLLLDGQSASSSMRTSWRLTRGHIRSIAFPLLLWWGAWFAMVLVGGALFAALGEFVLDLTASNLSRTAMVLVSLQALALTGGAIAALIGAAGHQFIRFRLVQKFHQFESAREPEATRGVLLPLRMRTVLVLTIAVGLIMSGFSAWQLMGEVDPSARVIVTAHRGSSRKAPENTLGAIRAAIADGADYAEIDVQRTRDGHIVLLHDVDFMRMAGDRRKLAELTLEEARELQLSGGNRNFQPETIATLSEAVALARGKIKLNIELKYDRPDPEMAAAVVALLRQADFSENCVITSLTESELRRVETIAPEFTTGLIVTAAIGNVARLPFDFLSVNANQVDASVVGGARRNGKAIHVWTVNTRAQMQQMISFGVDAIITDEPALLVGLIGELEQLSDAEIVALALRQQFGN
jgi:glycerophosphoryl diester phosphodiesterase